MDKPSIGRIVWYKDTKGVIKPAIVTYVHSETCVNLHVFGVDNSDQLVGVYTSVIQGIDTCQWAWPTRG